MHKKRFVGTDHRLPFDAIHPKTWEMYYTFCFFRNPWDRYVSAYFYLTGEKYLGKYHKEDPGMKKLSFEDFFYQKRTEVMMLWPQIDYIKHPHSSSPVNFIGCLENIASDLEKIRQELDLNIQLPKVKINSSNHEYYQKYFSPTFKNVIGDYYSEDVKRFSYDF